MKIKIISMIFLILILCLTGCGSPSENIINNNNNYNNDKDIMDAILSINNQSSYNIIQTSYAGVSFGTIASSGVVDKNVKEGTERIYFRLESPTGIFDYRTNDEISCTKGEITEFVIINNTLVEKIDNGLIDSIKNISTLPANFELKQDDIVIKQLDEFRFGTILLNKTSQIIFSINNTGGENLVIQSVNGKLINIENDIINNFLVTQPSSPAIPPNETTTFRITFNPKIAESNLSAVVNIKTNSHINNDFSFTISGNGKEYYTVGDEGPAGGFIFYDAGETINGWRYLEAAPAITERTASWGGEGNNIAGTQTGLGTGKQNTDIIVTWLDLFGGTGKAAQVCNNLNYKGHNDWFLPSKDELSLMFKNLKQNGIGGFTDNNYWSSSQFYENVAYGINFSNGNVVDGYKNLYSDTRFRVRAVRAF